MFITPTQVQKFKAQSPYFNGIERKIDNFLDVVILTPEIPVENGFIQQDFMLHVHCPKQGNFYATASEMGLKYPVPDWLS